MRWLLVLTLAACPFPELPDSVLQLAPFFESTGSLAVFGHFVVSTNTTNWEFTIATETWFR